MTQAEWAREINRLIAEHFNILLMTCPDCWWIISVTADQNRDKMNTICNHCWNNEEEYNFPDLFY